MFISIYLRKGLVYLPTVIQTNGASSRQVEPVTIVPAAEREELRRVIMDLYARGNVVMARLPRGTGVLLPTMATSAHVKSWRGFYRGASYWTLYEYEGFFHFHGLRPAKDGRGFEGDKTKRTIFPQGTAFDVVCDQAVETVQAAAATQS